MFLSLCLSLCAAAMDFYKATPVDPVDRTALEAACGVGVVITEEQIAEKVMGKAMRLPKNSQ